MLLVLYTLFQELIVPRRMDRVDKMCMWIIRICLAIIVVTLPHALALEDDGDHRTTIPDSDFFFACSGGNLALVQSSIVAHPDWVNGRTENGESCLHLAGIHGETDITTYLLEREADPNIRSTYSEGLRMHPLSWNVFAGHVDNVKVLLDHGADPNLDFDTYDGGQTAEKRSITALDVVVQIQAGGQEDDRFQQIEKLLRAKGAKTMEEIQSEAKEEL